MRVALCLSGQPRSAKETFPYIYENIIKPNNADVFFHTCFDPNNLYMEQTHMDKGNCQLDNTIIDDIIQLYKPVRYLVEMPKSFSKSTIKIPEHRLQSSMKMNHHKNWTPEQHTAHTIKQLMSMYYSIFKANEIKELYANENGFVYDFVIRLRFDCVPMFVLNCSEYNPTYLHYQDMGHPDELISDWINFGSNLIMNVYSSMYLNLEYINSPMYFPISERLPNTLEPSNICSGFSEYMIRDIMTLYKIPSKKINLRCILANSLLHFN